MDSLTLDSDIVVIPVAISIIVGFITFITYTKRESVPATVIPVNAEEFQIVALINIFDEPAKKSAFIIANMSYSPNKYSTPAECILSYMTYANKVFNKKYDGCKFKILVVSKYNSEAHQELLEALGHYNYSKFVVMGKNHHHFVLEPSLKNHEMFFDIFPDVLFEAK